MHHGNIARQQYSFVPRDDIMPNVYREYHPMSGWMVRSHNAGRHGYNQQMMAQTAYRWPSNAGGRDMMIRPSSDQHGSFPAYDNCVRPYAGQAIVCNLQSKHFVDSSAHMTAYHSSNMQYRMQGNFSNIPCGNYAPLQLEHDHSTIQHMNNNYHYSSALHSSPVMSPRSSHSIDWTAVRGVNHNGPIQMPNAAYSYGSVPSTDLLLAHQSKFRAGVPSLSSPATSPPYSPCPAGIATSSGLDFSNSEVHYFRSPMTPVTPDNRTSSWIQHVDPRHAQNVTSKNCVRRSMHTSSPISNLAFSPTTLTTQPYRFQWQLGADKESSNELTSLEKDGIYSLNDCTVI